MRLAVRVLGATVFSGCFHDGIEFCFVVKINLNLAENSLKARLVGLKVCNGNENENGIKYEGVKMESRSKLGNDEM